MSETEKLTFGEKLELYKKQKFPLVQRSELVDAITVIPNMGPFDFNVAGMPRFIKSWVILFLCGLYLMPLAAINVLYVNGEFFIPIDWLAKLNVVGLVVLLLVIVVGLWMFFSSTKGIFDRYKKVIDYIWRFLDGRGPRKGEFRVERFWQLWPIVDDEVADWEAEALEYEKELELADDGPQLMALPGMTPELEKNLKDKQITTVEQIATTEIKVLKKVRGINDDFASILIGTAKALIEAKDEPEAQPEPTKRPDSDEPDTGERKRTSSMYKIQLLLQEIPGLKSAPFAKDDVREGLQLRHEFLRIVRGLAQKQDDMVYTLMECAGGLNILVISRYPLTGGEDSRAKTKGNVEFRDHSWVQRTYMWQDVNTRATAAWFTQLAEFKCYTLPDEKARALGKEAKVQHCPIAFLNYSDGQAEDDDKNFRSARMNFKGDEALKAESVYNVNIAERFMERDKILTSTLARWKTSIKAIWREAMDFAKHTIAQAVNMVLLERKYRQPGRFGWAVNIFSNKAVRYFFYIVALACIVLVVSQFLGLWSPTGGGVVDPGGGAEVLP